MELILSCLLRTYLHTVAGATFSSIHNLLCWAMQEWIHTSNITVCKMLATYLSLNYSRSVKVWSQVYKSNRKRLEKRVTVTPSILLKISLNIGPKVLSLIHLVCDKQDMKYLVEIPAVKLNHVYVRTVFTGKPTEGWHM